MLYRERERFTAEYKIARMYKNNKKNSRCVCVFCYDRCGDARLCWPADISIGYRATGRLLPSAEPISSLSRLQNYSIKRVEEHPKTVLCWRRVIIMRGWHSLTAGPKFPFANDVGGRRDRILPWIRLSL